MSKMTPTIKDSMMLTKAADLIDANGHAKYERKNKYGQMCLHGALYQSITGKDPRFSVAVNVNNEERRLWTTYVLPFIRETNIPLNGIHRLDGGAEWNNHRNRTKKEVVTALRGGAQLALAA